MPDQFQRPLRWIARIAEQIGRWLLPAVRTGRAFFGRTAHGLISVFGQRDGSTQKSPRQRREDRPSKSKRSAAPISNLERAEGPLLEDGAVVYAIGDIHGRADLLSKLLDKIEADIADLDSKPHLVFLGDYIDRGLQSRQVIETLLSDRLAPFETYYLKGNHEDALLSFLSDPSFGPKWAAYGGRETLVSYGVRPPRSLSLNAEWEDAHDAFLKAIPNGHQTFLMSLPTSVRIGGYGFAHAGLRPGKKFAEQTDHDLMWIRDEFLKENSTFDVMVVHGHTPVDAPHSDHRRINVDTGAYFTGRLTAAKLTGTEVEFIATET